MVIYPAIDIKQGKCVRLLQGRFSDMTVYADDPIEVAVKWEQMGARYIHVVDLDGALTGKMINHEIIQRMVKTVNVPIQMGGGIRDIEAIDLMLSKGVTRVILGTSAVSKPALVKEAAEKYGENIVIGIDAKDGKVAIEGWEKVSAFSAIDFARKMQGFGIKTIVYTDIARDGMLQGPNVVAMREMVKNIKVSVIASGGVSSIDDIVELKNTGVSGVIIGKALYTGKVDLPEALIVSRK